MNNQVIVIFGASGGVGSTLARRLSKENKRVILCSRNKEKLKILSEELNHPFYICDGTSEESVQKTVESIISQEGKIDGAANCIGSFFIKPLGKTSLEEFNQVLRTNLSSCFNILKATGEKMAQEKHGSIVLISSCAASIGLMHHEAIGSAKGAVESLVRSGAASYAQRGVRVNGIAPGLVDTPLSLSIRSNDASLKGSMGFHPLGRIGTPEDITSSICWLLSNESSWMTGEILHVDGGLTHIKLKG